MKIAIVEDQEHWANIIIRNIKEIDDSHDIISFTNGKSFVSEAEQFDVVLMDIELGEDNGYEIGEFIKKVYPDIILIFVTESQDYVRKGYQIDTFRYITKNNMDELEEAITESAKKLIQEQRIQLHVLNGGELRLKLSEIVYIDSYDHSVNVHSSTMKWNCEGTISSLMYILNGKGFYLVHQTYIVNMSRVRTYSKHIVEMSDGTKIPISRRKITSFKNEYLAYMFG